MAKPLHKATHSQMRDLAALLVATEQDLHNLGMHATARAVNRAVRIIGYEFAGDFKAITEITKETP